MLAVAPDAALADDVMGDRPPLLAQKRAHAWRAARAPVAILSVHLEGPQITDNQLPCLYAWMRLQSGNRIYALVVARSMTMDKEAFCKCTSAYKVSERFVATSDKACLPQCRHLPKNKETETCLFLFDSAAPG
jgi:hypothetical protein